MITFWKSGQCYRSEENIRGPGEQVAPVSSWRADLFYSVLSSVPGLGSQSVECMVAESGKVGPVTQLWACLPACV